MNTDSIWTEFVAISTAWDLTDEQRSQLIQADNVSEVDDTVKERIVKLSAIYHALHVIFDQNPDQADSWVQRPNSAFGGSSALSVMLEEEAGIEIVRKYIQAISCNS